MMPSVNPPTPALVTQRAAARLPRLALVLLCCTYVLPGVFGRDPWRNADLTAFATMLGIAEGRTPWLAPTLGGWAAPPALLPHWLGAIFIKGLSPWMEPALAARLPFALLLVLTLALIWYATFHLARTEAAQPVAFAFGGEASPVDYARALADGALLATIATLGLLQLGHETTPELVQLCEVAGFIWALAAAPFRGRAARVAAVVALVALALSGAPAMALAFGAVATLICWRSSYPEARAMVPWLVAALVVLTVSAWAVSAWHWRVALPTQATQWMALGRLLIWFCWPVWPLMLWTLWRWRQHWQHRHIAVPLATAAVALAACVAMGGTDRALMLAVPGMAVLAAFALPTLKRSTGAAIDWFSVFFFSMAALAGWVIYCAMQTGMPAKPLANIMRLAPGFQPSFSALALLAAALASAAWLWLVRWRTSRHRHPLWKSLVLPAGGVALAWLLTMTLWLPALDYARSPRALVNLIGQQVPFGACVLAPGMARTGVAALEVFGHYEVRAVVDDIHSASPACKALLIQARQGAGVVAPEGWQQVGRFHHPADRVDQIWVFVRQP
jgi:4-amino-4-deoxy-L-arabinose transferase-like glycosyltransferase